MRCKKRTSLISGVMIGAAAIGLSATSYGLSYPDTLRGMIYYKTAVPKGAPKDESWKAWAMRKASEKVYGAETEDRYSSEGLTLQIRHSTIEKIGSYLGRKGPYYKLDVLDKDGKITNSIAGNLVVVEGKLDVTIKLMDPKNEKEVALEFTVAPAILKKGSTVMLEEKNARGLTFKAPKGYFKDLGTYKFSFENRSNALTDKERLNLMKLK